MNQALSKQNRPPNFMTDYGLYLVLCFLCPGHEERGKENWSVAVATGSCAWCGWSWHDKQATKDIDKEGL